MISKKDIAFIRLYWVRILGYTILALVVLAIIAVSIIGLYYLFTLDSYLRKARFAEMPFNLFLYLIVGSLTAVVHTFIWIYFVFGGGFSQMGQKKVKAEKVNISWSDVVGMEGIKREVVEVIRLIKDRTQLKMIGGKLIKGVLLIGPPGCGKTYLAKAIATETGLPFVSAVGSEFIGMFMGMGSARIKNLFKEARILAELHGGCIIFIDEIDTIARPRVSPSGFGGGIDYNATVNQILTEMDGLRQQEDNIVVFAATNVHEDALDDALMRPGRFDRKIYVGRPGLKDRETLLRFYFDKVQYDPANVDLARLARLTVGNSPADIANLVRESTLIAVREGSYRIVMKHVTEAHERIELGLKTEIKYSEKDREIVAYHEAGHAVVMYLLVPTKDVFKASIIPRRNTGGAVWSIGKEERHFLTKEEIQGEIMSALGGFLSEKIHFGTVSTGAESDLSAADALATNMVSLWGMGPAGATGIAKSAFYDTRDDKEEIISSCIREVTEVLNRNKNILERLAQDLLAKEELGYDELEALFREYGKSRLNEKELLERKKAPDAIGWDDIIGMEGEKEEAKEIVSLIKDRVKIKKIGGQIIKGLLLFGPPGCGKTYLATAIANEAGIPFIAKSGSEFVEKYVGVGASRVRSLFSEAREKALSKGGCIIFIDEMDALGARRNFGGSGGEREHNQTLNQFLVEMDGLKEKDVEYNIVVIGATNVSEDYLDPAVLRPGRFDRKIHVKLPTYEDRKKLFAYYLSKVTYNRDEVNPEKFAAITRGYSPADIANLIKEAALLAVRNNKEHVGLQEIEEARERIELGLRSTATLSTEELKSTAYHEAGHCITEYFFGEHSFPFKLSIVHRDKTLGVLWKAEKGDAGTRNRNEIISSIKISLAGYAAERLKCGVTSAGVGGDFTAAMRWAETMVWHLGMGKSGLIGNFDNSKDMSEELKSKLNADTQELLQECLKDTEELLRKETVLLEHLAQELLAKKELNYSELEQFFKQYAKGPLSTSSPQQ